MMFAYQDLIGKPFDIKGRGPDIYDCWGLLMETERRISGRELPDFLSNDEIIANATTMQENAHQWVKCERKPGAALWIEIKGYPCHVARQIDDYWMIHTWEGAKQVVKERLYVWERRIIGAYEYVG